MHRSEVLANPSTRVKRLFRLLDRKELSALLKQEPRAERTWHEQHRRLSPTEIDQLVEDYRSVRSVYALARIYKMHRNTVAQHLKDRGVVLGKQPLDETEIERARELRAGGLSLNAIGREMGKDPKTVKAVLG